MPSGKEALAVRTWAECVAGSMSDPVKRLRFIRSVAPLTNIWGERRRRWRRPMVAGVLAITSAGALFSFFYAGAAVPAKPEPPLPSTAEAPAHVAPASGEVWLVDHSNASDSYSNGLQIDNTFGVAGENRSYLAFPVAGAQPPAVRSGPAGIVFHGTESQQVAFEAGHNEALKRIGESLLDYVRRRRSYHFVIDRFGRVHRIVAESDVAEHAGNSAWADTQSLYLNLNQSFFGVAFEARTAPGAEAVITAAQTRSAALLTEMLRARYRIPASNCVTHAQVSVNPSNMRIGYHVDWASGFPFGDIGLPDNYASPVVSIWRLGFECDPTLRHSARSLRSGVEAAERLLARDAAAAGEPTPQWRQHLRQRYRQSLAAVRHGRA